MIRVSVLYFASLRQAAGVSLESIELDDNALAVDLLEEVVRRHPGVENFRSSIMLARNREWVDTTAQLADGDEVALMPPVSGG